MGSSTWSDDFYKERQEVRAKAGVPTFAHDAAIKSGAVENKVHDKLNPFKVNRESRDSDAHPNSVAIGVIFDVTGSMHSVPRQLQAKLPQLMGLLLRKDYVRDPQILFGAVGDYFSDRVPLQVGQFESGVEQDDDLTKLVLEGGGGGSYQESYQNALHFFAHHTSIDCFEKRGKKGYLFIIGDEMPYDVSTRGELSKILGDEVQADVPIADLIRVAQEKYHVFFIIPKGTSHYSDPKLKNRWSELLSPENVLMLEDPEAVCESIGLAIGLVEGTVTGDTIATDLKGTGAKSGVVDAVANALDPLAKKTALTRVGTGNLPEKKDAGTVARL